MTRKERSGRVEVMNNYQLTMNNMSVEKKEMDEPLEEKRKKFDSAI